MNCSKIEAHFHREDVLKKSEKILLSEMCQYKYNYRINKNGKNEIIKEHVNGLIIITNCALRFKERTDAIR
jgi:hypothetical protein